MTVPDFSALFQQLDYCQSRDVHALRTRLHGLKKRAAKGLPTDKSWAEISAQIAVSQQAVAARRSLVPTIQYPDDLPVVLRREEILAALAKNQVLILCGETGSGKTTQLPKLALEAGRGVRGLIGHTQPRRIAARSVASRIAEELDTPLGEKVGFQVRFAGQVSDSTLIKVMTDGILLAEIHSDPLLSRYDTLIIDEAHERSLNIDFLLGFLKRLLPKRPELKLIVTSATLDVERFSAHFDGAEIMSVEGRTYPVEMRYRPVQGDEDDRDRDLPRALLDAVDELALEGAGDILVFFDGERGIREAEEALRKHPVPKHLGATEILPLYARLSAADQARVFQKHHTRRIVLATNVAETSLTVPGIRYVIDTGLARVSRFSARAGVQRLQVEPISQAAARQRAGRCGRLGPGICIRLYAEDDFNQRPAHTDPEILRTNLAAVILRMESLRLGHVDDFPFLDKPDGRQIKAAYDLLFELQATDEAQRLTQLGVQLGRLPVDPRLGRMLLAGEKDGCLAEMLVIVSGLSVQDPRDRPPERQQAADQAHAAWKNTTSDFLGLLALWRWHEEQAHHLSQAKLRALCEKNFLSYVRMREWRSLHQELRGLFHEEGVHENETPVAEDVVHRALMTGLLGHLALRDEEKRKTNPAKGRPEPQSYLGVKGRRLAIHPGSALVKLPPKWLMSAQWLETTRLWGATNAAINPRWIEPLAKHLLTREVSEPHYQTDSGRVAAFETLSLYGLPVVLRRAVNYAAIDPAGSRRIFVREGMLGALEGWDVVAGVAAPSPARGGGSKQGAVLDLPPPPSRGRAGERGLLSSSDAPTLTDVPAHLSPRDFARQLRTNSTDVEQLLWQHLRAHRFEGFKFRRQQPLGAYTVDFVCLDRRVVIELDGGQHAEAEGYDRTRDAWLKAQGFEVMRFWNKEVLQNLEGVLTVVYDALARPAAPSPQPSPARGERAKTVVRRADELEQRGRHPWENAAFIQHNVALIAEIQALEAKARRPDILVDDAVLCAFFERALPPEVVDGVTLAAALRRDKTLNAALQLTREVLMRHEAEAVQGGRLPDRLRLGDIEVALRYHFEPGAEDDGVTASLPLAELNRLDVQAAEWLVPGLLQDKIEALIRALPKALRRHLVPAPDVARALVERLTEGLKDWPPAGSLPLRLSQEVQRMLGAQIEPADWPLTEIEPHLRLRVELVDDHGELRGSGRDLAAMQQALGGAAKRAFVQRFETRKGLMAWSFGELAEVMVVDVPVSVTSGLTPSPQPSPVKGEGAKSTTTVYPALIDAGESVTLQPMDTAEAAAQATANGLTRLFVLAAQAEVKALKREVARDNALCLLYSALPALKGVDKPCADMQDEVVWRVARAVFLGDRPPGDWPREPEAFAARVALCRPRLYAEGLEALRRLRAVLQAVQSLQSALQQAASAHTVAVKDMQAQLAGLFARDFIRATPPALWQRLPVYVQAASRRLERLQQNPERERQARVQLEPVLARVAKLKSVPDEWVMMLEEWRVQLFAQELKTAMPVSLSRVNALLEGLGA
ncbi:MAG: ATP-dependent RNA helicase HrpA [Gammaproteobacteria bacterium 28-57-27]|nr:MAG: ATP-dependent RNA helicase HrpA [Gammaproteobacteria bacterium 28-57-27]